MDLLAHRIRSMEESATISMAHKSRELKAQGIDIIDLSLGEPDFDTPTHIREAAKHAIDKGFSHYTPVAGYHDIRQVIADKFKRDNGLLYTEEQIVMSTGAKQSLANLIFCLVNPGDEVILPAPFWVSYSAMVHLAQGVSKVITTNIEGDFKISPQQLEEAVSDRSRVFMFSTPCNPTGSVYSRKELAGLVEVLAKYPNITIISDEIYELINFTEEHVSIGVFEEVKNRVVTVNGLSKGFAMTGWRLGYMGAPLWIAQAVNKFQGQMTSATCSITQRTVEAALNGDMTEISLMKEAFLKRRNLVLDLIKNVKGLTCNVPGGAFYVFPDVTELFGKSYKDQTIEKADDLCIYLLSEAQISTVTGSAFGAPSCIRISYATSEDKLKQAMKRLAEAVDKLH